MVTVVTKTVGAGKDYATPALAEAGVAALATSEFGGTDLVAADGAIVFDIDAGTYTQLACSGSGLTTDATRNVTYRAAAGAEHGGSLNAGVILADSVNVIIVGDDFTTLEGLVAKGTGSYALVSQADGVTCRGLVLANTNSHVTILQKGTVSSPTRLQNCVAHATNGYGYYSFGTSTAAHTHIINCTLIYSYSTYGVRNYGGLSNLTLVNYLGLHSSGAAYQPVGSPTITGSNCFSTNTGALPAAVQGTPYPITASTAYDPGAGDFALYVGKNGALLDSPNNDVIDGGVGPASNSDVPTTDILGDTRSGTTTNPGAFALAQAAAVLTRTIGPVGRDYATFTAAEADVTNIGGSADLVFENERIEFLADAATYAEAVVISSSLTTDVARNVTYKPAAGSEHGGVPGVGVIVEPATGSRPLHVSDDFTVVDGLNLVNDSTSAIWVDRKGVTLRALVLASTQRGFFLYGGTATDRIVVENCVSRTSSATSSHAFWVFSSAQDSHVRFANCTGSVEGSSNQVFRLHQAALAASGDYINCLALTSNAFTSTGTATGSNNFGGSTNPWPVALQGSPYPITATTDTLPGVGDFAIYEAETGQLYDNEDNAVWQAGAGTSTAGVPKLDILGVVRATGSCNPGAFEAAVVLTAAASVPLSNNAALHSNQLETQIPWIWLYELQTADDPPKRYRLTNFTQSVEFGLNASGQPLVYSPAPITHGDVQEGTDGSLPTIAVTVAHAGPLTGSVVDAANGFVGLPVRLMLVSALDIASGSAAVIQKGEVVSASMQKDAIVLQVSAFNLYQLQFPPFIHSRRRCRWIFGSVECGYNVSVAGAGFTTCNKTLANCEERGDDEVSLGFPRKHPSRFGAFPGIPRAGQ